MSATERDQRYRSLRDSSYQSNTLREAFDDENFQRQEDARAMLTPTDNSQLPATDRSHGKEDKLINEDDLFAPYVRLEGCFQDRLCEAEQEGYFIEIPNKNGWPRPWIAGHLYGRILFPVYNAVRRQLGLPRLEAEEVMTLPDCPTVYMTTYKAASAAYKHLRDSGKLIFADDKETFSQQMRGLPTFLDALQEGISEEFGLPYPPPNIPTPEKT